MFPRWHILSGAVLALLVWLAAPGLNFAYIILLFLSSFLIDIDHYFSAVFKTKNISLFNAFDYNNEVLKEEERKHKLGIREKSDFHFLHTVEFHILIGLLSLLWTGFFYVFLGMMFHSLLDLYALLFIDKRLYVREYFFTSWLLRKLSKKTNESLGKQKKSRYPKQDSGQGEQQSQQQYSRSKQVNYA